VISSVMDFMYYDQVGSCQDAGLKMGEASFK
jgi:hypothetical protein